MKKTGFILLRIVGGCIWVLGASLLVKFFAGYLLQHVLGFQGVTEKTIKAVFTTAALLGAYYYYVRLFEKRDVDELNFSFFTKALLGGGLVGFGSISLIIGLLWSLGAYSIQGCYSISVLGTSLVFFMLLSVMEELLFRGMLYRILETELGIWWALGITSILFMTAHVFNENISLPGLLSATLGSLIFGLMYSATGRLWLPISFHMFWNFSQNFYGVAVSGNDDLTHFIKSNLVGPAWLTGGDFGPEASLITIVVCFTWVLLLVRYHVKRSRLLPPLHN